MRFVLTIVIYALCCVSTYAASDSAKNAIVRVEVRGETTNGPFIRFGTGFIVGKGASVITARHLLYPRYPWKKDEITQLDRFSVYVVLRGSTGLMNDRREAKADAQDENADVALLSFGGDAAPNRVPTCPEAALQGNPNVSTFGFASTPDQNGNDKSSDESLSVSSGSLNDLNQQDLGRYRISTATRPGFSGAPVFLDDQIVGVLTGGNDGRLAVSQISLFTPLRKLRGTVLAACDAKCRLPAHGVEGYRNHEHLSFESDWTTDHTAAWQFCDTRIRDRFSSDSSRKFVLREITEVVSESPRNGVQENSYKYRCTFEAMSNEIYRDAEDPSCPNQVLVQALPR